MLLVMATKPQRRRVLPQRLPHLREWREHISQIEQARGEKKLTVDRLGARMGTDKGTVSKMELHGRQHTIPWLERYAHALGLDDFRTLFRLPGMVSLDELVEDLPADERGLISDMIATAAARHKKLADK